MDNLGELFKTMIEKDRNVRRFDALNQESNMYALRRKVLGAEYEPCKNKF